MKDNALPKILIKFKKTRLYFTVISIISILCVTLNTIICLFDFDKGLLIESIEILILLTFLIIVFFLIVLIYLKKIILNEYAIILSTQGIFENSNFGSIGMINWNDIEKIDYNYYRNKSSIEITISKEKYIDYIKNQRNKIKKCYLNMFLGEYTRTNIVIPEILIDYEFDEFYELLCKYYLNSKE